MIVFYLLCCAAVCNFAVRHKFLVSIDKGLKVYKAIEIVGGKAVVVGWRTGNEVQRTHEVLERGGSIYVVRRINDRA